MFGTFAATRLRLRALPPLLIVAIFGCWPRVAVGQTIEEVFEETAEVMEVQVPVNVVGKDGEPVRGLTAEDFQIFDGNKRQEITGFRVVDLALIEPGFTQTEIARAVPAAARRHFLLLFDLSFSTPVAVLKAREAARKFVLDSLHPTDLAAVATHDAEWGPKLVVTFTPDRVQLARAIDSLGAARFNMAGQAGSDPLRFMVPRLDPSSPGISDPLTQQPSGGLGNRESMVLSYLTIIGKTLDRAEKSYSRGRIFSWAGSMAELARLLDSVKGRKHVVYFSEGFDGRLLLGRTPDPADPENAQDRFNIEMGNVWMVDSDDLYGSVPLQNQMAKTLEEFRRADTVIQAVDISGLGSDSAAAARVKTTTEDALFYVANETGGEFFENANNFHKELEKVLEHTSVTYLLSFQPSVVEYDGEFHRLRVKADLAKGSQIFFRRGYYSPRPFEQLHPLEKELLASDAIASAAPLNEVDVEVLAAPFRASDQEAYVPVIIEVDGESLLKGHEGTKMTAEFYTYVSNERGQMLDFFTQLVSLDVGNSKEAFMQGGLKYYGHLFLEPGEYLVRVLVRNSSTGRTGVKTAEVTIPAYDSQPSVLLPPLFLESQGRWVLVREDRQDAHHKDSVIYPFTVNGEPFVPSANPVLGSQDVARVCLVGYNLSGGELEIDAQILDGNGEPIPGGAFDLVERTVTGIAGLDKFLVRFQPKGLASGDYRLEFAITDLDAGSIESSSIPITVLN